MLLKEHGAKKRVINDLKILARVSPDFDMKTVPKIEEALALHGAAPVTRK